MHAHRFGSLAIAWTLAACTGGTMPVTDTGGSDASDVRADILRDAVPPTDSPTAADVVDATDAQPVDAPTDPCAGRIFCDDFEGHTLGMPPSAPWQRHETNGSVDIDGTHTHSGTRALHVRTDAGSYKSALGFIDGAPYFPIAGGVVYGRMMFYTASAANDGVHWTMLQGTGPLAGHDGVTAYYRYGGMWMGQMMANYETNGASTDCWNNTMDALPTGRWTCMEWRFDTAQNDMRFWLDGTEVTAMHVHQTGQGCIAHDLGDQWLAPTFTRMSVGWESYQQDDAREAWIDDVVFDDAPIGCP